MIARYLMVITGAALLLNGVDAHAGVISDKRWKSYKAWAQSFYPERDVALAVAPNGSNCAHFGNNQAQAKAKALQCCKVSKHNPSNANCKIVDVNLKRANTSETSQSISNNTVSSKKGMSEVEKECFEAFYRQNGRWWLANIVYGDNDSAFDPIPCLPFVSKDMKTWIGLDNSELVSTQKRWCATKYRVWQVTGSCPDGLTHRTKSIAEAAHQRLQKQATTASTAKLVAKKDAGFDGTAAGLDGKRLGVQRATTHQCLAEKLFPGAELVLYGTQEEVWQDLATGRLDAQLSDSLRAYEGFLALDAGKGFGFLGGAIDDVECQGVGAGFAIRK